MGSSDVGVTGTLRDSGPNRYRYVVMASRRSGAHLDIQLLGPPRILVDGRPLAVDTRKAVAILALLGAESRPFARDELAALLWPESDDMAARGALRRTLSTLRTAIGTAADHRPESGGPRSRPGAPGSRRRRVGGIADRGTRRRPPSWRGQLHGRIQPA
jgi:hypothetical protein